MLAVVVFRGRGGRGNVSSDDHQDSESNALVPRPGTGLAETGRRTHPVLARMSRDLLARAEAQGLSTARYRLGKYVFREPDYRQILDWAEAGGYKPEYILECLEKSRLEPEEHGGCEPIVLIVEDGAILSLVWDFEFLQTLPKNWQKGLLIHTFGLKNPWLEAFEEFRIGEFDDLSELYEKERWVFSPKLPQLHTLCSYSCGIAEINLSQTPKLNTLKCNGYCDFIDYSCEYYGIKELDLSCVSGLINLDCSCNELVSLDLSPVPNLTKLRCSNNQIEDLNLSFTPNLKQIDYSNNEVAYYYSYDKYKRKTLKKLDIALAPNLITLICSESWLENLDLSRLSRLTKLDCSKNWLTQIDLSPTPLLTEIYCSYNKLKRLDLKPVPNLTKLDCYGNQINILDLSPAPELRYLNCDSFVQIVNAPANLKVEKTRYPRFDNNINW
jgi:hypothetical protein